MTCDLLLSTDDKDSDGERLALNVDATEEVEAVKEAVVVVVVIGGKVVCSLSSISGLGGGGSGN